LPVTPGYIVAHSSTNTGGNTSWVFPVGDLTGPNVTLGTQERARSTTATIAFDTTHVIPLNGKILVTFPVGFDLSAITGASSASDLDGNFDVTVAGQVVTVARRDGTQLAEA